MGTDIYMTVKANGKIVNPPKGHDEWAEKNGHSADWAYRSYFDFEVLTGHFNCRGYTTDKPIVEDMVSIELEGGNPNKPDYEYGFRVTLKELEAFDWDTTVWVNGVEHVDNYLEDIRLNGRCTDHSASDVGGTNTFVLGSEEWTNETLREIANSRPNDRLWVKVRYWKLARDSGIYKRLLPALRSFNTEDIVVEFRFD